jgi:hypothetical protein
VKRPPRKSRGQLASKTARKPLSFASYAVLTAAASIFGAPFCFFEQLRSRVADHIDNERSES